MQIISWPSSLYNLSQDLHFNQPVSKCNKIIIKKIIIKDAIKLAFKPSIVAGRKLQLRKIDSKFVTNLNFFSTKPSRLFRIFLSWSDTDLRNIERNSRLYLAISLINSLQWLLAIWQSVITADDLNRNGAKFSLKTQRESVNYLEKKNHLKIRPNLYIYILIISYNHPND